MSRRDQQPELDCWLAREAADGGNGGEERDDEEYDISESSLSIATTPSTSRFQAVLVATGMRNSCGHNSAFSLLRDRVAAQVQESVSRVKSRLSRVMRRRPRYCSTACSRRLLLSYTHLPSTASVTSRRTQSADNWTTFSQTSDVCNGDYFGGEGSRPSSAVATANVFIDLSLKPPLYQQQQLAHNLQKTSHAYSYSGHLPNSSIQNIQPNSSIQNIQPPVLRSTSGSAQGGAVEPRTPPGTGKTTHGSRRVYAPESCLLANRSCGSGDANSSPEVASRRIYLPPAALKSMAHLSVGQQSQPLSHQKMHQINNSEVIDFTVCAAETSEEEVTWTVPLAKNSSQQPLDDASTTRSPAGGGGGGCCCGRGGKAKIRRSVIGQDPVPKVSDPVAIQGQTSSSDRNKLEPGMVESEDVTTISLESAQSSEIAASTTSTTSNWRWKSQLLSLLPEETMAAGTKTRTPIPMGTTTEECFAAPVRVPWKPPSTWDTVETSPHPTASMNSRKPSLTLSESGQSAEVFRARSQQVLILPTPRQEAGPQSNQPYVPQSNQPYVPQSNQPYVPQSNQPYVPQSNQPYVPQSNQPYVPQLYKRSGSPPCLSSDLIATSHLPSGVLESKSSPGRSSNLENNQQMCRLNTHVIQPPHAFRHSSHCQPSKLLVPPQVTCKPSEQRTQPSSMPRVPSLLDVSPEIHFEFNQIKSDDSKSTKSQASGETSRSGVSSSNGRSSSWMTKELETTLIIDGDTHKKCMLTFGSSQCTIGCSSFSDTVTSASTSTVYEVHVTPYNDGSTTSRSNSSTIIQEVGADNWSLSTTGWDSLDQKSVNERIEPVSQVSTYSDVSIYEVHVGCMIITGESVSQTLDDVSIEEVNVGCTSATSSLNEALIMSSHNNKADSSYNTCSSERADGMHVANLVVIENRTLDATSQNCNATNSQSAATEYLTIRLAECTRAGAALTEVDLRVARQACSFCHVAPLPTVNLRHDEGSSYNDPAIKRSSIKCRGCDINDYDSHDTDVESPVEDESSTDITVLNLARDRPHVEVLAHADADWVWQQRQICLIQTPPLVLHATTVPFDPAGEEKRVWRRPMRIHQYLVPTKVEPGEYAAFKGTVSWLADCQLSNSVQAKSDALPSVAGYRPVISKVHHVTDRSLKLATTAPLQLLRSDVGRLMTSAAVRGIAACQCSTGSVAPMLSTKFSNVETPDHSATALTRCRANKLKAPNNAAADVAAVAGRMKPLPTVSQLQFAQILHSSGESRWLCLTKLRDCQQQEQTGVPWSSEPERRTAAGESLLNADNWEGQHCAWCLPDEQQ